MILNDKYLHDLLDYVVNPSDINMVQPASIDLRLGTELKNLDGETYNLSQKQYILEPDEFILGSTYETIHIPSYLVGIVNGKSSIGRLGVMIHVTAGYIDPGFHGNITLEIKNVGNKPFRLNYQMCICQLILESLRGKAIRPYGHPDNHNHYQNSKGTKRSWIKNGL